MRKKVIFRNSFDVSGINKPSCYSFLNFASLTSFFSNEYSGDIKYFCDGILMAKLVGLLSGSKVQRVSFDFTSIAVPVFQFIERHNKKIYLIGASEEEIELFLKKIKGIFPKINVVGYRNGFFSEKEAEKIVSSIASLTPDYVLVGLGAGKQEQFGCLLRESLPSICVFTCGGFIRQESYSIHTYYPNLIDKLNLRAFYRMYKEPHTIKRYFLEYPKNALLFICYVVFRKVEIVFEK